ncbi:Uncharacterized protein TCM_030386 [Theobroma cacao]|uniref:Uncharacterized protein n=1 Tax=Theobroma cacao TaxID=3641 RepID=A0A061GP59_THECC|nr:Uncharacterized protein TCM_030386 [Theobroma cacao]
MTLQPYNTNLPSPPQQPHLPSLPSLFLLLLKFNLNKQITFPSVLSLYPFPGFSSCKPGFVYHYDPSLRC